MKIETKDIILSFERDIDNGSGIPDRCVDNIDYDGLSDELFKFFSSVKNTKENNSEVSKPIKREVLFSNSLKAEFVVINNELQIIRAVNGWGEAIESKDIHII